MSSFEALQEAIKAKQANSLTEVSVLGVDLRLREMTAKDREDFWRESNANDGKPNHVHSRLIAKCLCDVDGKPLATGPDAWKKVAELPVSEIDRLFDLCKEKNGMLDGNVDKQAKNSEPTPGDASSIA